MKIIARKKQHRLLSTIGFPAKDLKPLIATRVLGEERKAGQYTLSNGTTKKFKNFKELTLFSDQTAGQSKYIIIKRDA